MNTLLDQIDKLNNKDIVEDNLFVKNIIVNKEKNKKHIVPYIATEKWVDQLVDRLQLSS